MVNIIIIIQKKLKDGRYLWKFKMGFKFSGDCHGLLHPHPHIYQSLKFINESCIPWHTCISNHLTEQERRRQWRG